MTASHPLFKTFDQHPLGICGQHDPAQVVSQLPDLEQRLSILTLGVVLDTNPLSKERWGRLLALAGHWLLDSARTAYQDSRQVQTEMQSLDFKSPGHIARVWWQLCRGVQGRFQGSWRGLIAAGDRSAMKLQAYLHGNKTTFPVLSGPTLSARWLDLVHRVGGIPLQGWDELSVPRSAGQEEAARLFGMESKSAHPALQSALMLWPQACQRRQDTSCGLKYCPGRG